ncbi:MAG: TonB-dependent receptor plug domain-containing protein [Pseudomonadota bacterium]
MLRLSGRGKLRYLIHLNACLATSIALPLAAQAQDETEEIEEVVVTGSFIRNSAFAQNSPVDTVSQADLFESGSPSMSNYIRDMTYTQNTDVVSNVLSSQDGAQDSVGASFNLRGLGENSTLTLVDGTRTISSSVSTAVPEIAIDRLELVLDGGSALYGSDAVAGVVNIIPNKDFEGFRARSFYQRTQDGAMEDMNTSALWGKAFDNGIHYVGAAEARTKTPLMQYERQREWMMDDGSSVSGNPGVFRQNFGADPNINLYAPHGGALGGPLLRDPACGTFNEGYPDHGQGKMPTPSGVPVGSFCRFEYTSMFAYSAESTDFNVYNTLTWEATDWLRFNATLNNAYRVSELRTTSTTAVNANNRAVLIVRDDHPANPWGVDVSPYTWRPVAHSYTHLPQHLDSGDGARKYDAETGINRLRIGAEYDISDTWTGYTYYSKQELKTTVDSHSVHLGKLQLALEGRGGPNGNEYWNPFGSSDPRAPSHRPELANSQELTNWIFETDQNMTTGRDYLDIFETVATGEVVQLPMGTVQMAMGFQWRDIEENNFANPFDAAGWDYNTVVGAPLPKDEQFFSEARALFAEFQVPILETLDAQLAVRHERFKDFGLETTTPKIALRWEATPEIAVRGSWGESFLAPTPTQARPFIPGENCGEIFDGQDPFTGQQLTGGAQCSSGNPNLDPETSEIRNVGFTWEPGGQLDGLSVSLDYQEIEYTDRIRSLTEEDTVAFQFQQFTADTGITEANYDPTPGSATREQADAWLRQYAQNPTAPVARDDDGRVQFVYRQDTNISSVWVDLFDLKTQYRLNTNNWGTFTTTLQGTYYTAYDYQGLFGGQQEALGMQNADTGIAPPLPQYKLNLRMNWFRDNQSASVAMNYWDEIEFDAVPIDRYGDGWVAPDTIDGEARMDARYAIVLDDYLDSEFTLSFGINNIWNERPQQLPISGGFESRLSTPWGRQFWASVEWMPGF